MKIAGIIGKRLRGGEVIELVGDLGSGKTTFVRGLAKGMGSSDAVSSPSFTISNQYRSKLLTLYHFDFYRLSEPGILAEELAEVIREPSAVVTIEWADIVEDILPSERMTIRFSTTGDNSRMLDFSYPDNLSYLIPEVPA